MRMNVTFIILIVIGLLIVAGAVAYFLLYYGKPAFPVTYPSILNGPDYVSISNLVLQSNLAFTVTIAQSVGTGTNSGTGTQTSATTVNFSGQFVGVPSATVSAGTITVNGISHSYTFTLNPNYSITVTGTNPTFSVILAHI